MSCNFAAAPLPTCRRLNISKKESNRKAVPASQRVALRRLVAAEAVSSIGDGLVVVAFPLLALTLTTNAVLIAGVAVAARLPWLLLSLPAGALVDRVDRRRLAVNVEVARAVVLGALAVGVFAGRMPLGVLYAIAFLVGTGETVVIAATRGAIPTVVPPADVPGANGLLLAADTAGERFAGPALGGVIFGVARALPFISDAISYAFSAVLLRTALPSSPAAIRSAGPSITGDIRTGLRWFVATPVLRVLAVVVASFAFCQSMVLAVLVLYAARVLHLGHTGYGLFLTVAAIGDVAASLLAGRVHARVGPFGTILGAGLIAGGCYVVLGSTSQLWLAVAALTVEAAATSTGNVATLSVRHRLIPPERFGLVNNAFRMCVTGVIPLGALAGGGLTIGLGLPLTFVIAGLIQVGLLAVMAFPLKALGGTSNVEV